MTRVGFIGLGKLGMPCAEEIGKVGHEVKGYDIVNVESDIVSVRPTIKDTVSDCDIVFIAVPTPHDERYDGSIPTTDLDPKDFDYSIVKETISEADRYMNDDQLLVLISTVLPGTTRREFVPLIQNTRFAYNPYLIAMGSVAWDMVNPEMIMIGTEDGSLTGDAKELIDLYKTLIHNDPRFEVGTWDECECIKIFYNTWISTKISLVNMMQDVANRMGNIDVDVVTGALSKSNLRITGHQYMTAGMGDGGACHPRDNIALRYLAQELDLGYDLFDSIMNSREVQAKNLAKELVKHAKENDCWIYIHGKAYKPKVPYLDGSYSLLIGHFCQEMGHTPIYIDPYTGDDYQPTDSGVFLMAHSAEITYNYTTGTTNHKDEIYCDIPEGSVIVDPWRKIESNTSEVIHYGNTRNR